MSATEEQVHNRSSNWHRMSFIAAEMGQAEPRA